MDDAVKYNRSGQLDPWAVREIQRLVGAKVDGDPGPETTREVSVWQTSAGLTSDGKIGPATLREMSEASAKLRLILAGRGAATDLIREVYPDVPIVCDLSYHQDNPKNRRDNIAWATLRSASGVDALILKATEGRGYVDPQFRAFRAAAAAWAVPYGCYHYAHLAKFDGSGLADPIPQAEHLCETSGADRDGRLVWLDLERKTLKRARKVASPAACVDWALAFLERCEELTGRLAGVYWSGGQIREYLSPAEASRLRGRPTWWPYYPTHPFPFERRAVEGLSEGLGFFPPKHPAGWGWDLWQLSGEGKALGINGKVDINVFNGSREELARLFALAERGCT